MPQTLMTAFCHILLTMHFQMYGVETHKIHDKLQCVIKLCFFFSQQLLCQYIRPSVWLSGIYGMIMSIGQRFEPV